MSNRYQMFRDYVGLVTKEDKQPIEGKTNYGCLMAYFQIPNWNTILAEITSNDLDNEGLEYEPHATILYGFDLTTTDKVVIEDVIDNMKLSTITDVSIKQVDIFENEKYDVLHLAVESKTLTKLNKYFTENFDYHTNFPEYNPHITIAYLKSGKGEKYKNLDYRKYIPNTIESNLLVYSDAPNLELKDKLQIELN